MERCEICKEEKELRYKFCFDCASAQKIIGEGLDMWNEGTGGEILSDKSATERLRLLIENGWICMRYDEHNEGSVAEITEDKT